MARGAGWRPRPAETTIVETAESLRDLGLLDQLSYWDAAIIEASRAMGCTHVLSEDLSDGQDYGGVRVTNPFR
jgi:predicted nucleic acid-binding protein